MAIWTVREVMAMYKWLKQYAEQFGEDFPLKSVMDKTKYEICRIIQECCERNTKYGSSGTGSTGTTT